MERDSQSDQHSEIRYLLYGSSHLIRNWASLLILVLVREFSSVHSLTQNLQWLPITSIWPQPFSHCPQWTFPLGHIGHLHLRIYPSLSFCFYSRPSTCLEHLPLSCFSSLPKSQFLTKLDLTHASCNDLFLFFRNIVFSMANNVCTTLGTLNVFQWTTCFHNKVIISRRSDLTIFFLDSSNLANFLARNGPTVSDWVRHFFDGRVKAAPDFCNMHPPGRKGIILSPKIAGITHICVVPPSLQCFHRPLPSWLSSQS